jgi:hypothetical protein
VGGESSSSQMAEPSRDSGMQQKAAGEVSNSVAAKQAPVLRPDQADVTSSAQKVAHAGVGEIAPSSVALPTAALPEIQQPVEPAGPHHQSRWSYSVVYRYDQQNPWDTTWQRLEQQGEQDKWRGRHAQRSHYFIYVGVYAGERMAQRRADELLAQVGEAPDILARQKVAH